MFKNLSVCARTKASVSINFTIIVNWNERGFGCAKKCSYCNWRSSPLLPHGPQSFDVVGNFIRQCKKSFITISGGGDPLYKFDDNYHSITALAGTIKKHGYKVRIITREIQHLARLNCVADYVSVSLDSDVLVTLNQDFPNLKHTKFGFDLEFSLVLPPLPEHEIAKLIPQYLSLVRKLGHRLVLRENLNSVFSISASALAIGRRDLVFVPKKLCLSGRYLSAIDSTGHDIVQDNAVLAMHLMERSDVVIFGGFVKHLINPVVHLEYDDIDVIALHEDVMEELASSFSYVFKETSPPDAYPRYFMGKSSRAGKSIQVILLNSMEDARNFVFGAQYTVDRVGYCQGFVFDPDTGEAVVRNAINTKRIEVAGAARSKQLFHTNRGQIERRHTMKLFKKGFTSS
jgi:hypothetical protein